MNCAAKVAIARYKPFTLAAGIPKIKPTNAVIIAAEGIETHTGKKNLLLNHADAKAPNPKKTACPTEICPVHPTNKFKPKAAIP